MSFLLPKNDFPVDGRTVLITGGSRGLGRSAARKLAEKGASIIIVGRDVDKLKESIEYISQGHVSENNGKLLDVVWCCAGSCHPILFIDTPIEQFQAMMDSNYFSCVYIAHAALNAWLRPANPKPADNMQTSSKAPPPARHLIFTASLVSFYTFIGWSPYSPSKAAIRSPCDALSQEMNLYAGAYPSTPRVKLHTVYPGTMPTESFAAENLVKTDVTKMLEEGDTIPTPDQVAANAIAGLERGQETVTPSFLCRLVSTSMLSGSTRGGFWIGLADTVLSWIAVIILVFIRGYTDSKVIHWAKKHGASGMVKPSV